MSMENDLFTLALVAGGAYLVYKWHENNYASTVSPNAGATTNVPTAVPIGNPLVTAYDASMMQSYAAQDQAGGGTMAGSKQGSATLYNGMLVADVAHWTYYLNMAQNGGVHNASGPTYTQYFTYPNELITADDFVNALNSVPNLTPQGMRGLESLANRQLHYMSGIQ